MNLRSKNLVAGLLALMLILVTPTGCAGNRTTTSTTTTAQTQTTTTVVPASSSTSSIITTTLVPTTTAAGLKTTIVTTTTTVTNPTTSSLPVTLTPTTSTTVTTTATLSDPQILRVNLGGEPASIDPSLSSWSSSRSVISQVFQGLLGFDRDLNLVAIVATAVPTVANGGISADGKTYTFKLKSNATWSDGQKLTAGDFEYALKRLLNPANAAAYASTYFSIAGAEAYNTSTSKDGATLQKLRDAVGVKALDASTLQISLNNPQPTFPQLMALWPVYPLRQDVIEKYGSRWTEAGNYIGNGPFMMTEWVHNDHITFKQNPNYWGIKPALTQITYRMISSYTAVATAYLAGEIDMMAYSGTVPYGSAMVRISQLTTFAFQFNIKKAPFDNILVRQALTCAFDRNAYIDTVRGGSGAAAFSWVPPGIPGYNASLGKDWSFNISKARQLLAEAGYSDVSKLPPLSLQYESSSSNNALAQFLQKQLKDNLGINLTLQPVDSATFQTMIESGNYTWTIYGWGADYPDPENFMTLFMTGNGNNRAGYSSAEFDALANQALKELDNTKRLALWAQAQAIITRDCPVIPVYYPERIMLVKTYLWGLTPTGMDGQLMGDQFWSNVYIKK